MLNACVELLPQGMTVSSITRLENRVSCIEPEHSKKSCLLFLRSAGLRFFTKSSMSSLAYRIINIRLRIWEGKKHDLPVRKPKAVLSSFRPSYDVSSWFQALLKCKILADEENLKKRITITSLILNRWTQIISQTHHRCRMAQPMIHDLLSPDSHYKSPFLCRLMLSFWQHQTQAKNTVFKSKIMQHISIQKLLPLNCWLVVD